MQQTVSSSVQAILTLLGMPVSGNPSQFMFEHAFAQQGLDWRFLSVEVTPEQLADAVRGLRAMGFRGGSCADPHKQAIGEHLDRLSEVAQWTGAVNCFRREEAGLVGENTEGRAMVETLRRRIDPAEKSVVILGAGRMARAVAVELALAKAGAITIVSRSETPGQTLVELLRDKLSAAASWTAWDGMYQVPAETQVLIDATSLGSDDPDDARPLDLQCLTPEAIIADVAFNPPRTWLLAQAAQRGCPTIPGLEIYIEQAMLNYRYWTGSDADPVVLRESVEEFLEL